jgi:putative tryptophan/tyrosine transport system ATP-binding protein
MITFKNINKVFNPGTAGEVVAVKDLNLTIKEAEFVTLIGANGSGKSTLLNLLAGSVNPDSGEIFIGGNRINGLPEHRRGKWIARVFQNPLAGTASELSILENFRLASIRTQSKSFKVGTNAAFRALVKNKIAGLGLGLENNIDQNMGTLSGGQRQALTLLMAVMDDARILLLDEPAAALDPKTAVLIMKLANQLIGNYRLTAVLVTHQLRDIPEYGNRVIQLDGGGIKNDRSGDDKSLLQLSDLLTWF